MKSSIQLRVLLELADKSLTELQVRQAVSMLEHYNLVHGDELTIKGLALIDTLLVDFNKGKSNGSLTVPA